MKLNFWQWLGVVLLVVATIWWLIDHNRSEAPAPPANDPMVAPAAPVA